MVVESLIKGFWTLPIVENLVTQADTMYHFVGRFNEYESNIEKHHCMEFFICQMQINKRMCEMIDKLIDYDLVYEAQQKSLRGKAHRHELLSRLNDNIKIYMKEQDEVLNKDVYEIKKIIQKTIIVDKCNYKTYIYHPFSRFEYDTNNERHKYYFIKILGYTEEQLRSDEY